MTGHSVITSLQFSDLLLTILNSYFTWFPYFYREAAKPPAEYSKPQRGGVKMTGGEIAFRLISKLNIFLIIALDQIAPHEMDGISSGGKANSSRLLSLQRLMSLRSGSMTVHRK